MRSSADGAVTDAGRSNPPFPKIRIVFGSVPEGIPAFSNAWPVSLYIPSAAIGNRYQTPLLSTLLRRVAARRPGDPERVEMKAASLSARTRAIGSLEADRNSTRLNSSHIP